MLRVSAHFLQSKRTSSGWTRIEIVVRTLTPWNLKRVREVKSSTKDELRRVLLLMFDRKSLRAWSLLKKVLWGYRQQLKKQQISLALKHTTFVEEKYRVAIFKDLNKLLNLSSHLFLSSLLSVTYGNHFFTLKTIPSMQLFLFVLLVCCCLVFNKGSRI